MGAAVSGSGRIVVGMSGGVDSSVAAALLRDRGWDVVGVTLHLWDAPPGEMVGRCCAPEEREDARRACDRLGIPHYVFDRTEAFLRHVVEPFVEERAAGRTPSPCVHCNRAVKIAELLRVADALGASHVATGHYARVVEGPDGARLLRGRDPRKDQSYFLYGIGEAALARLRCPLGDLDKPSVREQAARLGLPAAAKPDSQELCFVPDGDFRGFLRRRGYAPSPGWIVDETGERLGQHAGLGFYTVGQRRGLGLGGGPARYVLRVIPDRNEVVVAGRERLGGTELRAGQARWLSGPPEAGEEVLVQVRARHRAAPARIWPASTGWGGFRVRFDAPQFAITPGQAAVVYRGDEVLGGGLVQT